LSRVVTRIGVGKCIIIDTFIRKIISTVIFYLIMRMLRIMIASFRLKRRWRRHHSVS